MIAPQIDNNFFFKSFQIGTQLYFKNRQFQQQSLKINQKSGVLFGGIFLYLIIFFQDNNLCHKKGRLINLPFIINGYFEFFLQIVVIGTLAALRHHPGDDTVRIGDITGFAVHTI